MAEQSGYLKPKAAVGNLAKRRMEDGLFRNPPTYTELGGFSSEAKFTDPTGRRHKIGPLSLEKGGPSAQRGKPI